VSTVIGSAEDVLGAGRLVVLRQLPYLYARLLALVPRPTPGLGTIGVTKQMILMYDPAAVARWSAAQAGGALVHEIMHLAMGHHARCGARDPRTYNVAGDLAINPGVLASGLQLPEGVVMPAALGLPSDLTADEYYDLLAQRQPQPPPQQPGGGEQGGEGDEEEGNAGGQPGEGKGEGKPAGHGHEPRVGGGWCGSCAGRSTPGEPAPGEDVPGARSEAEVARAAREIAEAIQEAAAKGQGNVPAGWARWARAALEPPRVPWQTVLARAVRAACARRPGAVSLTSTRMGRRQAGVGYGPGRPVLPALYSPVPEVAVVVDTSGSMGQAQLEAAMRECRGVLKAVGARVRFLAADARVHTCEWVEDWQTAAKLLKGGGGTSFVPAFEKLAASRQRPSVVVYLTDGWGTAPACEPPWTRTIWGLVGDSSRAPCAWGTPVQIDD